MENYLEAEESIPPRSPELALQFGQSICVAHEMRWACFFCVERSSAYLAGLAVIAVCNGGFGHGE